jgi:hypothetical protein
MFLFMLFVSTRFTTLLLVDVPFLLHGRLNITACKSFWMGLRYCTVPRISIITNQALYILVQQIILALECNWPRSQICNLMSLLPFQSIIVVLPKPTVLWRIAQWNWTCVPTLPRITVTLIAPRMLPLGVFPTHVYFTADFRDSSYASRLTKINLTPSVETLICGHGKTSVVNLTKSY